MDGGIKQALFLSHLRDRATEALATTKGRFWLAACPSARRIKPCGREDANCWRTVDGSAHLPCSSFRSVGIVPVGGREYSVVLGTLCDPNEMQEFASFAKEAGAAFIASPPPGVTSCGPPEQIWAGALTFWRPCAKQAVATHGDCLVIGQPWAASLAAIRAWGELIPQPPTIASPTADEIALRVTQLMRPAEDGSPARKRDFVFAPSGDGYFIRAFGAEGHFSDLAGFRDLHKLVRTPSVAVAWATLDPDSVLPAFDPRATATNDRRGNPIRDHRTVQPTFDSPTTQSVIEKIRRLREEITEAKYEGDDVALADSKRELEKLMKHSGAAMRPDGSSRDLNSVIDKSRPKILDRLKTAYRKLREASPPMLDLAKHFELSVRSGSGGLVYEPAPRPGWTFDF